MPRIRDLVEEAKTTTLPDRLRELAAHSSATVRDAVARNIAIPDDLALTLSRDDVERVRLTTASTMRNRPTIQEELAHSDDRWVRSILAHTYARDDDRSLAYATQRVLVADEFWEVRQRIAETTNFADLFERCMTDGDPRVRGGCAANPRISRDQFERILNDSRWEARAMAISLGLRFPDNEQLVRAAADKSVTVRWNVLFRVDRPREAIELIASDPDVTNRNHAKSMLDGNPHMSDQVVEFSREERRRGERGLEFAEPPAG